MRNKKLVGQHIGGGKKKWLKPILTVLVRGGGNEAVLASCKNGGTTAIFGPANWYRWCIYDSSSPGYCGNCSGIGAS